MAYAEIVGLLYRYCRACERGTAKKRTKLPEVDPPARLIVREVMTREVWACRQNDQIFTVIDTLSTHRLGTVLVLNEAHAPVGVISKTNLIVAYHHGISAQSRAAEIMSEPAFSVPADALLSAAIQQMLLHDVQRLFVHREASDPDSIFGVLALSDAARFRSGSCRACSAGRMLM